MNYINSIELYNIDYMLTTVALIVVAAYCDFLSVR